MVPGNPWSVKNTSYIASLLLGVLSPKRNLSTIASRFVKEFFFNAIKGWYVKTSFYFPSIKWKVMINIKKTDFEMEFLIKLSARVCHIFVRQIFDMEYWWRKQTGLTSFFKIKVFYIADSFYITKHIRSLLLSFSNQSLIDEMTKLQLTFKNWIQMKSLPVNFLFLFGVFQRAWGPWQIGFIQSFYWMKSFPEITLKTLWTLIQRGAKIARVMKSYTFISVYKYCKSILSFV